MLRSKPNNHDYHDYHATEFIDQYCLIKAGNSRNCTTLKECFVTIIKIVFLTMAEKMGTKRAKISEIRNAKGDQDNVSASKIPTRDDIAFAKLVAEAVRVYVSSDACDGEDMGSVFTRRNEDYIDPEHAKLGCERFFERFPEISIPTEWIFDPNSGPEWDYPERLGADCDVCEGYGICQECCSMTGEFACWGCGLHQRPEDKRYCLGQMCNAGSDDSD